LLLGANRVVPIERLAEDLYGEARPTSAVTQIHGHVSQLRKLLGADLLETRAPGYLIKLGAEQLDLHRFERLTRDAGESHARGDDEAAAGQLADALALWRGPPLADLADEPFAALAAARLDDLRLGALEQQIDAWLALGRNAESTGTLDELIAAHPFRERFRAQLMLALYRSGRQADALDAYRSARQTLVERFGIEPTPELHRLQHAILAQDRSLERDGREARARADTVRRRTVLVAPSDESALHPLLTLAGSLGRLPGTELVVTRLVADGSELGPASAAVNERRAKLQATTRAAVFTSDEPAADLVRLAATQDAELLVVDGRGIDEDGPVDPRFAFLFEHSPADVAAVAGVVDLGRGDGVFVPFGGGEHDWAALELAALLARAIAVPLRLVGTSADPQRGRRDASRLLAAASLAVERVVGVATEPLLANPGGEALADAVGSATLVVFGCSPRWRHEGIGSARRALVRDARMPVAVVHRGPRPGALAPPGSATRFTWTIEG